MTARDDDGLDEDAVVNLIRDETADLRRDLDEALRQVDGLEDAIDSLNERLSKLEPPR